MPDLEITREALTYEPGAPVSYFRDLALAEHGGDVAARARLQRHADELKVEIPAREQRARVLAAQQGIEYRTEPTRAAGQGGSFAPPLWLIDAFATAVRPGRVLAALAPGFLLPQGVQSINLPRLTTGARAQTQIDGGAVASRDIVDTSVTSPVVTIAGDGDVALQLLEQSPPGAHLDYAIFKDLAESYDHQLETQLIAGTGTGGQFTGILSLTTGTGGVNAVAYTDASPTGPELAPLLGQAAAQIGDNRSMPPEVWMMRTARWAWYGTAEDSQGQPLSMPQHAPPPPIPYLFDDHRPTPVSAELGWPIYTNDAIPATLLAPTVSTGTPLTGGTQDAVICCRPSDMMVFESAPRASVQIEVLSGTLSARLQLVGFCAALVGRYPTGISTVTGSGLAVQSGF